MQHGDDRATFDVGSADGVGIVRHLAIKKSVEPIRGTETRAADVASRADGTGSRDARRAVWEGATSDAAPVAMNAAITISP